MINILVTGAGGGGGNNMISCIKKLIKNDLKVIGTNCSKNYIFMSTADETYLAPEASEKNYLSKINDLRKKHNIHQIIPCNDREVLALSKSDSLKEYLFLPNQDLISSVQNKSEFFKLANNASVRVPINYPLTSFEDLEEKFNLLKNYSEKVWVRPQKGSGSKGATWVNTFDQAMIWIKLWVEMRKFKISDFQICEFLPGRDLNIQTIWDNGNFVCGTMVERLGYYGGEAKLSGMASTPSISRRIHCDTLAAQIELLGRNLPYKLNGSINIDIKADSNNVDCMTEINIGRFPMIIRLHEACINKKPSNLKCYIDKITLKKDLEKIGWHFEGLDTTMYRELDNLPKLIN